jgi:hypothetical protein
MTDYDRYNTLTTTPSYTELLQRYLQKWFGKPIDDIHIRYINEYDRIQIEFSLKDEQ